MEMEMESKDNKQNGMMAGRRVVFDGAVNEKSYDAELNEVLSYTRAKTKFGRLIQTVFFFWDWSNLNRREKFNHLGMIIPSVLAIAAAAFFAFGRFVLCPKILNGTVVNCYIMQYSYFFAIFVFVFNAIFLLKYK